MIGRDKIVDNQQFSQGFNLNRNRDSNPASKPMNIEYCPVANNQLVQSTDITSQAHEQSSEATLAEWPKTSPKLAPQTLQQQLKTNLMS